MRALAVLAALLVAVPTKAAEDTAPEKPAGETRPSFFALPGYRIGVDFLLPASVFAIKGLVPGASADNLVPNASFTPSFSPLLKLALDKNGYSAGYTTRLSAGHAFRAVDLEFPLYGDWRLGGFWRDYRGFDEQFTLEENSGDSSTVNFDSSAPTWERADVRFSDLELRLRNELPHGRFTHPQLSGMTIVARFFYGASYRRQNFSSPNNLIPEDKEDEFGAGSTIQALRQHIAGAHVGAVLELRGETRVWDMGLEISGAALRGYARFENETAEEKSVRGAFGAALNMGYAWSGEHNEWGLRFRYEGLLGKVRNLGFSSQFLALKLHYAYSF